ncbi:MAG TPA: NIPSNAP family protein [Flavisolibacter sp.]|nr:NIPSNAP family protein [Flavisolibacter sp.]
MTRKLMFMSLAILFSIMITFSSWTVLKKNNSEFYCITVYHFNNRSQETMLDNYFQNALLPALHRNGIKTVGVFKAWANDTAADKLMYVFAPFRSFDLIERTGEQIKKDKDYTSAASAFLNAEYKNPPYTRKEVIITKAFPLAPEMQLPNLKAPKHDRVYELRSYESATEQKFENKVKMFNDGKEVGIFKRLNFNAIFYSEAIVGSKMPNLMYMTSFENKADRDAHWKSFSSDSAWKKLSSLPEYQNNVSHIDINFLYPTDYSDF